MRKSNQSTSAPGSEGHEGFPPPIPLRWFPGWVTVQVPHRALTPGSLAGTEAGLCTAICPVPGNKNLPVLVATARMLVPRQALAQGAASVGTPCGTAVLAGACAPRYGRDTGVWKWQTLFPALPGQLGEIVGSTCPDGTPTVPEHWGQPVAEEADVPGWPSLKAAMHRDQHSTSRSSLV